MFQHQGAGDWNLQCMLDLLSVVFNKLPDDGAFVLKNLGVDT
jgi:hypothetical protein